MHESEANYLIALQSELPLDVLAQFRESRSTVSKRTLIPWGEHCTECVWPTCYTTCDLYSPRQDGKCRRFVDGMVRVESPATANSYLLKIRFKRWGKLWTPGNVRLHSAGKAARLERRDFRIGSARQRLPLPTLERIKVTTKRYGFKKRMASPVSNG